MISMRRRFLSAPDSSLTGAAASRGSYPVTEVSAPSTPSRRTETEEFAQAPKPGVPIMLTTLPKSGSIFLKSSLEKTLGIKAMRVSPGYFPLDLLDVRKFQIFSSGGNITQTHISAHPLNLTLINVCMDRAWLHLRDPRAATLSSVYEVAKYKGSSTYRGQYMGLLGGCPAIPMEYHDWSLQDRISWLVRNFMPGQIKWITEWLDAIDNGKLTCDVLVTEYLELVENAGALIEKVLTFHGIDPSRHPIVMAKKNSGSHFRSGRTDEWKQWRQKDIDLAGSLIPDRLAERFGWEKGSGKRHFLRLGRYLTSR